MTYLVRRPTEAELPVFRSTMGAGFGELVDNAAPDSSARLAEHDRDWAAFDVFDSAAVADRAEVGEMAGTATAHSFSLTMPGGAQIPAGGLAGVAVLATHRRRGILRSLMQAHLDECVERGEVASLLTASETGIYDRFGYGWAVEHEWLRIAAERGRFRADLADGPWSRYRPRTLLRDDMVARLPAIYDRVQALRPGMLSRIPEWWDAVFDAKEGWKGGGDLFCAVVGDPAVGEPKSGISLGYVLYVLKHSTDEAHLRHCLTIKELVATDADAEAALWRHCLDRDLVSQVDYPTAAVDAPIRRMLAEPRWMRVDQRNDEMWLRPLDVPRLLEARTFASRDVLVVDVVDSLRPEIGGRFRIDSTGSQASSGSPGLSSGFTATVERVDAGAGGAGDAGNPKKPDLSMPVDVLGAISLGGVSPVAFGLAGRISVGGEGALQRAHAMFATATPPWNPTRF